MNEPQAKLTEGSVARHLAFMTLPVLGGIFAMMLQSFADTYFIGQVGSDQLAALKKPDGSFDVDAYRALLNAQGMSPEMFEARMRQDATMRQAAPGSR